jgi:hypothetical protein
MRHLTPGAAQMRLKAWRAADRRAIVARPEQDRTPGNRKSEF